ncbi:MAG: hypothetical protein RIC03_00155 [Cyclobacteriaceae bacterium]
MKFDPEVYKNFGRWRIIFGTSVFWIFGLIFVYVSFDSRNDYGVTSGKVAESGNTTYKGVKVTNHIYIIKLSNRQQPFAIGTNTEWVPILDESFKGVQVDDFIQVTFEENWATNNEPVNMMVREIRKENQVLYDSMPTGELWNGRMKLGLGSIGVGLIPMLILVLFERKYREHKRLTTTTDSCGLHD